MTWNIHGALGRNPRFDLNRVVELIRDWNPDIVALQELDSRRVLADGVNPFEFLPSAVGVYGVDARSLVTKDGDYGQALVSRWPLGDHEVRDISYPEREPRRAIRAEVKTPDGPVTVVTAHLGLSIRERHSQVRTLVELATSDGPTVVTGDFNDWFWVGSVRAALSKLLDGHTRFRTFPAAFPLLRLDRIYCRPGKAMLRSFVDRRARKISDHLPVIADLAFADT